MDRIKLPQVSPVAVTTDLQEFIGNNLEKATTKIEEVAYEIDISKSDIVQNYNLQTIGLATLLANLGVLESSIGNTLYSQADEAEDFVWVSDTFTSELKADSVQTDALINTDRGILTLKPTSYKAITSFTAELDKEIMTESKTLPGCNLLAVEVTPGSTNSEPQASFEETNVTALSNLFDNNVATHFEVERNFIYASQKVKEFGKAFVSDVTGGEKSVQTITNNYDWNVNISWPKQNSQDEGPDKKGYPIAEFISPTAGSINPSKLAEFSITMTLNNPETLSGIRVIPYVRHKKGIMRVKRASVYLAGLNDPVIVAKDFGLNTNETTASKFNLFNINPQEVNGKFIPINSSRAVEKITLHFSGSESEDLVFGHPFVWINLHRRSERNYGLFKTVDHEDIPKRLELFAAGRPTLVFKETTASAFGDITTDVPAVGDITDSENKKGPLTFLAETATNAASQVQSKNVFTNFAFDLISGTDLISNLLSIGGFNRTFTVTDQKSGFDLFSGFRSSVGIKSISLEKVEYSTVGSYISSNLVFPKPVSRISLVTETDIPTDWGSESWVVFSYSIDGGTTWTPIQPSGGSDFDKSIKLSAPVTRIRVKIDLVRPLNDTERTPAVLYYAVKGFIG